MDLTKKVSDTITSPSAQSQQNTVQPVENSVQSQPQTKFCKHCGERISAAAVVCPKCGCQVEEMHGQAASTPNIVITNTNTNTNTLNGGDTYPRNKWVAIALCVLLGFLGAHKFYEGKTFKGVLYFFTFGLFGIGIIADLLSLIAKPNPYYVRVQIKFKP